MDIRFELGKLGIDYQYIGNGDFVFDTLGLVQSKVQKRVCTFIDDEKFIKSIPQNISIILTNEKIVGLLQDKNCCVVESPRLTFFRLHNSLCEHEDYRRVSAITKLGRNCSISNCASIADKNVIIGNNVVIEEFVSIKENVTIGDYSIIRTGTIIGGEGFEFKKDRNSILSVRHAGGVHIGRNVEIQSNTCIDKALYPWDDTIVSDEVKVDNLVHIAHGVKVGKGTMIVANSGIGGRTEIGENSWIGFNATIRNGLKIGSNARINMGAVVTVDVKNDEQVTGNFAINHEKFMDFTKLLARR